MAEIRRRRTVIAAKVEATVGTSETLTASECLVLVYDAKFDATIPMFDRKLMDASISPFTSIPGTQMAKVTFKLEIKGSGTAGTAPALGLFLKACGMAETLVALTSATYAPISAAYPALHDGRLYGKEQPFHSWKTLPDLALLAIKWRMEGRRAFWHWVVFWREPHGAVVLDQSGAFAHIDVRIWVV